MPKTATFTVTLSAASLTAVSCSYATRDGTARASDGDYTPVSGVLTFAPGTLSKTVQVAVADNVTGESSETFFLDVSAPVNASILDGSGVAVIPGSGTNPGTPIVAGPLIKNGLVTNAYHSVLGRDGYFAEVSGTSEGQSLMIYGAYLAQEALESTGVTADAAAATFFHNLAGTMLDALGDGSDGSPILRQQIPTDRNTITLLHWLFAARGDVALQGYVLDYSATSVGGVLTIPAAAHGADVFRVWQIYPAAKELLYGSPFSPVVGGGGFDIPASSWSKVGSDVKIPLPSGAAAGTYKIVYGYRNAGTLPAGDAYEAYPVWTALAPGYSACAPDTFRWFDQAIQKAILHDSRSGKALNWTRLRDALRRTAVRGQNLTDLREVFKPLSGIPVFNTSGMFCFSNKAGATAPAENPGWTGYSYYSRAANGDILGTIPSGAGQAQLGRGFEDIWRGPTSYQDPDQFLLVEVSCTVKPAGAELFEVFVSATREYDPNKRWFCNLGGYASFVATPTAGGSTIAFLVPRADMKMKLGDNSALPVGTQILNFGISTEIAAAHVYRLRSMRLVSGVSAQWVMDNYSKAIQGSQLPYFPGAMPFATNADLVAQQFVGYSGNPFHGYQLPDFWLDCADDATAIHGTMTPDKMPIPDASGGLTFPISMTNANGTPKQAHVALMEQQLIFLRDAQAAWVGHGGQQGPFAHTYVLNTPARNNIGNPDPHQWVYTNDDPNTRWPGYQVRVVESLAMLVYRARDLEAVQDARELARTLVLRWLSWANGFWPNLGGKIYNDPTKGAVTIKGLPTSFDDPRKGPPATEYEEVHSPALVLRACMYLRLAGVTGTDQSLCDALMQRCWDYMELFWQTTGEMAGTWTPNPEGEEWFGFHNAEILITLCDLMTIGASVRPVGIPAATLKARVLSNQEWLLSKGVA